ncbi:hypothetical protein FJ930_26035 [Mesorhizobium sp. B2-4-15]|nr:hypothetical protein FJ930_26035 [Mesorhizobium sp. B2-4-15]
MPAAGSRIEHHAAVPQDPTNRCPDLTLARRVFPGGRQRPVTRTDPARTFEWFQRRIMAGGRSAATA